MSSTTIKCNFCVGLNKSDSFCSSHRTFTYIRGVRTLTCPELKKTTCLRCGLKGHTEKFCQVKAKVKETQPPPPPMKKEEIPTKKSRFALLEEDSSDEEKPKKKLSWSPKNEIKKYTPIEDSSANIHEEISSSVMVDPSVIAYAKFSGATIAPDGSIPWGTEGQRVYKVYQAPDVELDSRPLSYREILGLPPKKQTEPEAKAKVEEEQKEISKKPKMDPKKIINWIDADDYDSDDDSEEPWEYDLYRWNN